jgi:putative transposase
MDGKGDCRDNVFVERLSRFVKYEQVYLKACANVAEVPASIGRFLSFYNGGRPDSSLRRRVPNPATSTRSRRSRQPILGRCSA